MGQGQIQDNRQDAKNAKTLKEEVPIQSSYYFLSLNVLTLLASWRLNEKGRFPMKAA